MQVKVKKWMSAFIAMMCSLCFIVLTVSIYKTGIYPGINPEVDASKQSNEIMMKKMETTEGLFIDRNGLEITSASGPGEAAVLNYPESFSYLIGYNSQRLGLSGLRQTYCNDLFNGAKDNVGADLHLTINASLQNRLYQLLVGSIGSISVVNSETGELLALTSRGDVEVGYNVNLIDDVYLYDKDDNELYYSDLYNSLDDFWFDRATFAQDPPGSTAKMITATSLVENGKKDMVYIDEGSELNNTVVNYMNYQYGEINLQDALNISINTYFAKAGLDLGNVRLKRTFENFMVSQNIDLDFTTLYSSYSDAYNVTDYTVASNAYGQGDLVMSPLHIAMCTSALMNDGVMMKPYVVSSIVNNNKTAYEAKSEVLSKATDEVSANEVKRLLHSNAQVYGFYDYFSEDDVYIVAKTGTAEVSGSEEPHFYYAIGVEIGGVSYGICIDQVHAEDCAYSMKEKAVSTIRILMDELE